MRTLLAAARTVLAGSFLAFFILLPGPLLVLHCVLTGSADLLYRSSVAAAALALRLAGVRARVEGLENIPPGACLFIANHVSNVDPPAIVCALPRRVALIAKEAVFRIPIFGTAMRLGKFIPVNRANRGAALASFDLARRYLSEGMSFLVFAEGTRSPDGRLMKFKKGTFVLAIETGAPVVPVTIIGTQHVMPRGASLVRPGSVLIRFHPPVDPAGYTLQRRDQLMERVRAVVASGLPPEQLPTSPSAPSTARAPAHH